MTMVLSLPTHEYLITYIASTNCPEVVWGNINASQTHIWYKYCTYKEPVMIVNLLIYIVHGEYQTSK